LIYLDTHVVVWLYAGLPQKLSNLGKSLINENELYISPIVRLELQYLYEVGRIKDPSDLIVTDLFNRLGLRGCEKNFNLTISQALGITWTRDPFDRLIVGNAMINENILLTKDSNILSNYPHARWS
jgi:PIN domain nuclease of toxin-antitoxin system